MTEEQARDELRLQVAEMMNELTRIALQKLEGLMRSGCGIVDDHVASSANRPHSYQTAKAFMVAFLDDQDRQYRMPSETQEERRRIRNYWVMMP